MTRKRAAFVFFAVPFPLALLACHAAYEAADERKAVDDASMRDASDVDGSRDDGDATGAETGAANDANPRFCADHASAALCEDWDTEGALARWPSTTSGLATLALDARFRSAPFALSGAVGAPPIASSAFVELSNPTARGARIRNGFDLRIAERPASGRLIFAALTMIGPDGATRYSVQLSARSANDLFEEASTLPDGGLGAYAQSTLARVVPRDTWVRVTFDVTLATSSPATLRVLVDGETVLERPSAAWDVSVPGTVGVLYGVVYTEPATTGSVLIDNVVVDLQ